MMKNRSQLIILWEHEKEEGIFEFKENISSIDEFLLNVRLSLYTRIKQIKILINNHLTTIRKAEKI